MSIFSYLTLKAPAEGLFREKGSKFLAFAYPVDSEEDAKHRIRDLKKKYVDARHHGYAYILGAAREKYRAFDDGEPNHSAGDPILGQIRSRDLTNVLVVVVRYFGGVKLGVGGSISAYRTASSEALGNAIIIEKEVTGKFEVSFGYESTSDLMRLIKEFEIEIISQQFNEDCKMIVEVKERQQGSFLERITRLKTMKATTYSKEPPGQ